MKKILNIRIKSEEGLGRQHRHMHFGPAELKPVNLFGSFPYLKAQRTPSAKGYDDR